jgi:hypothetical protein
MIPAQNTRNGPSRVPGGSSDCKRSASVRRCMYDRASGSCCSSSHPHTRPRAHGSLHRSRTASFVGGRWPPNRIAWASRIVTRSENCSTSNSTRGTRICAMTSFDNSVLHGSGCPNRSLTDDPALGRYAACEVERRRQGPKGRERQARPPTRLQAPKATKADDLSFSCDQLRPLKSRVRFRNAGRSSSTKASHACLDAADLGGTRSSCFRLTAAAGQSIGQTTRRGSKRLAARLMFRR